MSAGAVAPDVLERGIALIAVDSDGPGALDGCGCVPNFRALMTAPPHPSTVSTTTPSTPAAHSTQVVPDWDDYWIVVADAIAKKSKDPRCPVGAVIVFIRDNENTIASSGFNGFARHIGDDSDLLADVEEKLKWMCHAEFNAIMNAARHGTALAGTKIYVTKFPCFACCNAIIQAGIKEIYTHDTKFWDDDPIDPDHRRKQAALSQAGIRVQAPYHPTYNPKPSARTPKKPTTVVTPVVEQTPAPPKAGKTRVRKDVQEPLIKAWPAETPRHATKEPAEE